MNNEKRVANLQITKPFVNKTMQPSMINIVVLLSSFLPSDFAHIFHLANIVKGIYSISTGGVTQKNISRQTCESGSSYRSIQRFFLLTSTGIYYT